jgi:formate hydrogenlyase subunit 3/multisubunit Na+/H+ antiporter MnhD subunit
VLFLTAGHLQLAHDSTAIADVRGVLSRAPLLGAAWAAGLFALLGLPPFALFASEIGMARGATDAKLAVPLAAALVAVLIAFIALARHSGTLLLDPAGPGQPSLRLGRSAAAPLAAGILAAALVAVLIAFIALARHSGTLLLSPAGPGQPSLRLGRSAAAPLAAGILACAALGVLATPLDHLLTTAAGLLTP